MEYGLQGWGARGVEGTGTGVRDELTLRYPMAYEEALRFPASTMLRILLGANIYDF